MALMETLKDDFEFGGLDSGKWSTWGSISVAATTNLLLELTSTLAANYGGALSLSSFDLTASYAFSQLVDAGNQAITSLEVYPLELVSGTNALAVMVNLNTVYARKKIAGSYTTVGSTVAYNSTTMKWFRIRESAGTTYWEYASDPTGSWTQIASVANPITITALTGGITIGTWQAESSISTVKVDNFNVLPAENQFTWMGYTWNKRIQTGNSMYNGQWKAANISGPDGSGYMTMSISNAGASPYGGEFYSAKRGWGYGTYTWVCGTRVDNLYRSICVGGMFLFDFTTPPAYREIDIGEVRDYNGNTNIRILYSHVWDNGGSTFITDDVDQTADVVQTHQCVWTPSRIIFASYVGQGTDGQRLNYKIHETKVPLTNLERVHFNIWVQNSNTPASTTATDVIIRSFTYERLSAPGNVGRHVTVDNGMSRNEFAS